MLEIEWSDDEDDVTLSLFCVVICVFSGLCYCSLDYGGSKLPT